MIVANMLFFGILNIPLFKYFCDVPTFNFSYIIDEDLFFYKNYFFFYDINNYFNFFLLSFSTDFSFFFTSINDSYFFIFLFLSQLDYDFLNLSFDYIEIFFQTATSNFNFIEFCSLQKNIYIIPNETHLVFFRMYNSVMYEVTGISIYLLYPTDYLVYFNKVQCFCFDELLFYPYESIDLPVIFFVSNDILNNVDFSYSNKIYLSYLFLAR